MFVHPGVLVLIFGSVITLAEEPPVWDASTPPSVPAVPERYFYAGVGGKAELSVGEIAARVSEEREARHLVWQDGWPAWRDWSEVPAIQEALSHLPPPLPVDVTAPAAPPPVPAEAEAPAEAVPAPDPGPAPGCCGAPKLVRMGGEVWFNASAPHLEYAGTEREGSFEPTFAVRRARLKANVTFGHGISGRLAVDFPQNGNVSEYSLDIQNVYDRLAALEGSAAGVGGDVEVSVRDYPKGWATVMKDAYLDWSFGDEHHRVRAGLQKPVFGSRDFFDDFDNIFLGGEAAYKSLAWRAGMEDTRDVGLSYRLAPVDSITLDAQILNGTGDGDLDDNAGKDLAARASFSLPAGLSVQASGMWGVRGMEEQNSLRQIDASLRWDVAFLRLLAEGLMGRVVQLEQESPFMGADVVAMAVIPVQSERFERLDISARYMFFDPLVEQGEDTVPDSSYIASGGAFLHWRVGDHQRVATGLVYENLTTQDLDTAVAHSLVGQVIWTF